MRLSSRAAAIVKLSSRTWELLESFLLGRKDFWEGKTRDNRLFINAVFWILRTGASWRDLPPDYRAYGTDVIVGAAQTAGMEVLIPLKKKRKEVREYKSHL